jgi:multidrug resistance efflux pump
MRQTETVSFPRRPREVSSMETTRPASSARRWSISLGVWLGVVLLLASVVIAAVSLRSHAGNDSSHGAAAASGSEERRWMSLGFIDVKGSVTPLYPVQPGRVTSIEAHENEPVKANAPLFHLEDSLAALKVQEATIALKAAQERVLAAQQKVKQYHWQIEAQKEAVKAAQADAELARFHRDKEKQRYKEDLTNEEAVKDAERQVRKAEANVRAKEKELAALEAVDPEIAVKMAQRDVEAKQVQLKEAQKGVDECVVRAPFAGTPLRILISVGETLGSNPRQPAIQFCPDQPLLVRAEVEQEFASRVHKDQLAIIEDHVSGQNLGQGRVMSLSRWFTHRRSILMDPLQFNDVRTLECIIYLNSTTQELRIGQRVRVQFPDAEK